MLTVLPEHIFHCICLGASLQAAIASFRLTDLHAMGCQLLFLLHVFVIVIVLHPFVIIIVCYYLCASFHIL